MIPFNTLYSELVDLVKATWPDILDGTNARIWEADHVAAIPFEEIQGDGPFAVIVFPSPVPVVIGIGNRTYQLEVEIWWAAPTTQGSETHRERAEEMASALWLTARSGSFDTGQIWTDPVPAPFWGIGLEINELLRAKKAGWLAAGSACTVVVGETPD